MKIAIIAHDGKKAEMVQFLMKNQTFLVDSKTELISTGTTGRHAESAGLKVEKVLSGPLGGDAQIAAQLVEEKIDMVFFFRDPLDKHPHEPDVQMLLRLCDVHNIPLASNPATAQLLINAVKTSKK